MNEDPQDVFGQMDTIFAHMVAEMTRGMVSGMSPHAVGYRIIIRGNGAMPDGAPFESVIKSRDPQGPAPDLKCTGSVMR